MHIKKLEVFGFKSFVDRTVIHFDHDVIGIVGPNGCGKSNIVDAIRWCMGEQRAKHLRGKSMDDVIFNGSENRGPAGMAEVTLTFDNSDPEMAKLLPEEFQQYAEVSVTRRLFRDGTSEYLINKTPVRLRDVTDLFLGTGVGTRAYSIIEQGRIGQVVSARPEDRRLFIEEAAGITKYKQRRKQAERKMELTQQNLLRLRDIVNEVERNRGSLQRQAQKAERYLRFREELEDVALHDASHQLLELIVRSQVEQRAKGEAEESAHSSRETLEASEQALEQARGEAGAIEQRTDEAARAAFEADATVAHLRMEAERCQDRLALLKDRLETGHQELELLRARTAQMVDEEQALTTRLAGLEEDATARRGDANQESDALSHLRQEEQTAAHALVEGRRVAAQRSSELASREARLEALRQRQEELRGRRAAVLEEQESLEAESREQAARIASLEQSVTELAEGKRLSGEEREALQHQLQDLRAKLLESERNVDKLKHELGVRRSRLQALEDLHRRLDGVSGGVKAILGKKDPTVLGLFADRIETDAPYTAALAGLLGERLHCIVVKDLKRGLTLLEELKRDERGRAALVPQHPAYVAGGRTAQVEDARVLGRVIDFLRFAPEDDSLVRSMVGDALLVATPDEALAVAAAYPGVTAVAQDGTVVQPSGVVSGGAQGAVSAMMEQKREMRKLRVEVEQLTEQERTAREAHTDLRAQLTESTTRLDQARQEAHQGELAHVTAAKDLNRAKEELHRVSRRSETLAKELAQFSERHVEAELQETEQVAVIDELRAAESSSGQELELLELRASEWKQRLEEQNALVTERRIRLAQLEEQLEATRGALGRARTTREEMESRSYLLTGELEEASTSLGTTAAQLLGARERNVSALEAASVAHRHHDEARALLDQIRGALGAHEMEQKELRERLMQAEESFHAHGMELQRLDLLRENLLQNVAERFRGLHLPTVVGDYHLRPPPGAEQKKRIQELMGLIDRMGPVNLDAAQEFATEEARFQQISAQKADIEQALEELDRAIKQMDRESKRRFKETFQTVNELFQATFQRLFRGGHGELRLTTPDDLLNTGVDILAQPPGKKLGNIELMSGGEKALTAVALIFAIFQHKPSPFCILDEVDAPLDEANVSRYNEAIRAMTSNSQFILITHIKKTMQLTDVLYGVTMAEPGVSRVVSVKVNDQAGKRSDQHAAIGGHGSALPQGSGRRITTSAETPKPEQVEAPDQVAVA